jgi:antitoxin VapB
MNGGSQAVRLPREFRFAGDAVRIWREGDRVILEPIKKASWPVGYWKKLEKLGPAPADFEAPAALPRSARRDRALEELDRD